MRITLLYFASLRETLGVERELIELPPGVHNAGELRAWLRERGEPWASALDQGRAVRVAVDRVMAQAGTPLAADAEVAFFPPVTGG